jgi:hypothetical protein
MKIRYRMIWDDRYTKRTTLFWFIQLEFDEWSKTRRQNKAASADNEFAKFIM